MREAVGGSLLLYLIIPIIILFIVFIGFVINYASAYRSANYIVTQIETCQSMSECSSSSFSQMKSEVKEKYHYAGDIDCSCSYNTRGAVCDVTLYVAMDLPLLGTIDYFAVKAETKTMYAASGSFIC